MSQSAKWLSQAPGDQYAQWAISTADGDLIGCIRLPLNELVVDLPAGAIVTLQTSVESPQVIRVYGDPTLTGNRNAKEQRRTPQ